MNDPAPHRTDRSAGGRTSERGAVFVEFAIIATFLVALVLGVFEIGLIWSDHQVLTQSARHGARVTSQLGPKAEADVEALKAVEASLNGINTTVSKIVVFEADANGEMPAACETAAAGYSGGANCNVYDDTSIANLNTAGWWGSGTSCGVADANWCPTGRSDTQATATYVGVFVEIERNYMTKFFGGGTHTMSEITVMRIEPGD